MISKNLQELIDAISEIKSIELERQILADNLGRSRAHIFEARFGKLENETYEAIIDASKKNQIAFTNYGDYRIGENKTYITTKEELIKQLQSIV